ncbi:hypothetical protein LN037_00005, partial [Actinomycetospora sp. SF1]|nr:hypothetical protein [Actinomycetospora soli]
RGVVGDRLKIFVVHWDVLPDHHARHGSRSWSVRCLHGCRDTPIHHSDAGSQYTAIRYGERLLEAGPTQADNLGALSIGDHLRKHEPTSGWTVRQTRPGTFLWTAPTGTHHIVEPDPYRPLRPVPRERFDHGITDTRGEPRPPRPWKPRTNKHGHTTDAQRQTLHDIDRRRRERQKQPPDPFDDDPPF